MMSLPAELHRSNVVDVAPVYGGAVGELRLQSLPMKTH